MAQKQPEISAPQLISIASMSMLAAALRHAAAGEAAIAGNAGWLCPLASVPLATGASLLIAALLSRRRPGEGLAAMLTRALGRTAGGGVTCLFSVWFTAEAGLMLASGATRLANTVYMNADPLCFMVTMLLAVTPALLGSERASARTAEIFRPFIWCFLLAALLLAVFDVEFENLMPVTPDDALPVLRGALSDTGSFTLVLAGAAFLAGPTPIGGVRRKRLVLWCCELGAFLSALCAVVIGRFGPELTARFTYPLFLLVRNVSVFGTSVRLEALIAVLWVLPDYVLITMLLRAGANGARLALGWPVSGSKRPLDMKNGRWLMPLCAAASLAVAIPAAGTAFRLERITDGIAPWVGVGMVFGLLPVCLVIGRLRKKL